MFESSASRRTTYNKYYPHNNNYKNMKPWLRNDSRSPSQSSNNGDWHEDDDSIMSKKNSSTEEPPVISLVECQNNVSIISKSGLVLEDSNNSHHNNNSTSGPSNVGGRQYSYDSTDCNDDKKIYNYNNHHQHHHHHNQNYNRNNNNNNQNYSSGGYGQYNNANNGKRNNNLTNNNNHRHHHYGGNNTNGGYGGYNQRRQFNNNFNNYNNGFRNYGNNRRQFPPPHNNGESFFHQQPHYNNNNHNHSSNGYYNNRGGGLRGYSTDSYNNGGYHHHHRINDNVTPLSSPEFEEYLPWPKRGLVDDNFYGPSYYSPNSRNCSPDNSPTSDCSGTTFPETGQTRDIVLNNGSVITAQSLGPYDYFVENLQNQHRHCYNPYPGYAAGNYFYGQSAVVTPATTPTVENRDSNTNGGEQSITLVSANVGSLVGHPPPSISNGSSRAESCTDSPLAEKTTTDWPDDCTEESDNSCAGSTRSHTPEEQGEAYPDLTVTVDPSFRFFDSFAVIGKDFSPTTFCLGLKRGGPYPHVPFPREWFEDLEPEEVIKQFSKVVDVTEKPFSFAVESEFTLLDAAIWTKYMENQQTVETFRKKVELWRDVYRLVRFMNFTPEFKHDQRNFPFFGLQVVGSTMSGFGSNTSDVDMCLVIRDTEVDQRFEAVERLQALSQTLNSLPFVENIEMIYAKVPILKFRDSSRRLDVDLNCNNFVGIRNTHLLYAYAQMDWRLKPLVLVVKLWAQFHGINDAKLMTMSSYSLVLMVIHFLQHGLDDPVLPNLQKDYPEKFSNNVSILRVKIHEEMPPWKSKNGMGLGELLILFLEYFSRKFDYTRNVVSVRVGGTITMRQAANYKSHKNDFHSWKLLCVEEPFDRTNTARSVYDRLIFERIIAIFYASWQRLLVSQLLDSIFSPFSEEDLRAISAAVIDRLR